MTPPYPSDEALDLLPEEQDRITACLLELDAPAERAVMHHLLERDPRLACAAESIAETLRVFSAEPVTPPSARETERAWARLRSSLPAFSSPARRHWISAALAPLSAAFCMAGALAAVLIAIFLGLHVRFAGVPTDARVNHRDGPLTTVPTANADPALATHLDSAERLLTEVNHTEGALEPATRRQAHALLLQNAACQQTAHDLGDLSSAAMLDDLGRVLTTIDTEPPRNSRRTLQLRMEMNTDGLLFQIRIIRQNAGQ